MKILSSVFILLFIAGLLAACGKSDDDVAVYLERKAAVNTAQTAALESGKALELGNLLWPSEQFDHKNWNPVGINRVVSDTVVAPDGTKSADLFIENTAAGLHRLETVIQGVTADKPYVFSIYAKAAGRSKLRLELLDRQNKKYGTATYDLQALELLANTGDVIHGGIEQDRDGWVRCWAQASFGGSVAVITMALVTDGTAHDYVGDGKSGLALWGAQLSPGTALSKYTATSTGPIK